MFSCLSKNLCFVISHCGVWCCFPLSLLWRRVVCFALLWVVLFSPSLVWVALLSLFLSLWFADPLLRYCLTVLSSSGWCCVLSRSFCGEVLLWVVLRSNSSIVWCCSAFSLFGSVSCWEVLLSLPLSVVRCCLPPPPWCGVVVYL